MYARTATWNRADGKAVTEAALTALIQQHKRSIAEASAASGDAASFFEVLTAIAVRHFADEQVEWAIFEAGLGGVTDATNVFDASQVRNRFSTQAVVHVYALACCL